MKLQMGTFSKIVLLCCVAELNATHPIVLKFRENALSIQIDSHRFCFQGTGSASIEPTVVGKEVIDRTHFWRHKTCQRQPPPVSTTDEGEETTIETLMKKISMSKALSAQLLQKAKEISGVEVPTKLRMKVLKDEEGETTVFAVFSNDAQQEQQHTNCEDAESMETIVNQLFALVLGATQSAILAQKPPRFMRLRSRMKKGKRRRGRLFSTFSYADDNGILFVLILVGLVVGIGVCFCFPDQLRINRPARVTQSQRVYPETYPVVPVVQAVVQASTYDEEAPENSEDDLNLPKTDADAAAATDAAADTIAVPKARVLPKGWVPRALPVAQVAENRNNRYRTRSELEYE